MRQSIYLVLFAFTRFALAADPTIFGYWKTIDDETGRAKGLVEMKAVDGEIKGFLRDTFDPNAAKTCEACSGEKKGQPIKGLELVWGVKATDPNEWGGGHIMDPANGKTYRVRFELQDEGKKLKVRGYLGLSMFGRTQYWERADAPKEDTPAPAAVEAAPAPTPAAAPPAHAPKRKRH